MRVYHIGSRDTLYACINDAETGELLINATVHYCIDRIQERGYHVVKQ